MSIHQSAIIEEGAEIGDHAVIGAFCHIGPHVKLGNGAKLHSHVVLAGHTTIGPGARIFPFASIGHEPQDLKYKGEMTTLVIGKNCLIREGVTMNPGTQGDLGTTIVGDDCVFLANSHVAHDCVIGNHVIFSNGVLIGGHCEISDNVIMGGGATMHQYCRIGNNAFVGALASVNEDIIPFGMVLGNRAYLAGLNIVGMKRAGIPRESINRARHVFKALFLAQGSLAENLERFDGEQDLVAKQIVDFIRKRGKRSLCVPNH